MNIQQRLEAKIRELDWKITSDLVRKGYNQEAADFRELLEYALAEIRQVHKWTGSVS
jgi:hypothetical protein